MLVIRPINNNDYPSLYQCAIDSGYGFTSLPISEEHLKKRIQHSVESFQKEVSQPKNEGYLMVAEDSITGEIAGTTGIEAAIGFDSPFYSYHISKVVQFSNQLNINNITQVLTFGNDYTGCTELCTLFLKTTFRKGMNGRLMSKVRFLMMAEHPHRFSNMVFAEMRGVSDKNGVSPFWKWLQEHFFFIDFIEADYLNGIGHKDFIVELMPKLPIYVCLLSKEAQRAISQVHVNTKPALALLENEGFRQRGSVAILDAGPIVECELNNIKSIRESFKAEVIIAKHSSIQSYLIANTSFENFRAITTVAAYDKLTNCVHLTQEAAIALQVEQGDKVRLLAQ